MGRQVTGTPHRAERSDWQKCSRHLYSARVAFFFATVKQTARPSFLPACQKPLSASSQHLLLAFATWRKSAVLAPELMLLGDGFGLLLRLQRSDSPAAVSAAAARQRAAAATSPAFRVRAPWAAAIDAPRLPVLALHSTPHPTHASHVPVPLRGPAASRCRACHFRAAARAPRAMFFPRTVALTLKVHGAALRRESAPDRQWPNPEGTLADGARQCAAEGGAIRIPSPATPGRPSAVSRQAALRANAMAIHRCRAATYAPRDPALPAHRIPNPEGRRGSAARGKRSRTPVAKPRGYTGRWHAVMRGRAGGNNEKLSPATLDRPSPTGGRVEEFCAHAKLSDRTLRTSRHACTHACADARALSMAPGDRGTKSTHARMLCKATSGLTATY